MLDGKRLASTNKTHYTFSNLDSGREYAVEIKVTALGEKIASLCEIIKTQKPKKRIDVTLPPYYAIGDGQTLNTYKLQQALDACDDESSPVRDVTFKNIRILPRKDGEMQQTKCRNVKNLSLSEIEFL